MLPQATTSIAAKQSLLFRFRFIHFISHLVKGVCFAQTPNVSIVVLLTSKNQCSLNLTYKKLLTFRVFPTSTVASANRRQASVFFLFSHDVTRKNFLSTFEFCGRTVTPANNETFRMPSVNLNLLLINVRSPF